jgi:hypothetical protein
MSVDRLMDQESAHKHTHAHTHTHTRILFNFLTRNIAICSNMDDLEDIMLCAKSQMQKDYMIAFI